jgi:pimeloyl-ACP methyl ester carboxylesterase
MYDSTTTTPAEIVETLERSARRFDTPCGDGTMAWRIWGEGPPVVFLHGAHGSWAHWIRVIPELSRRFQVICADVPGYGDSAPPHAYDTAWPLAAVVADGLRRLPVEGPVDLVGFSLGSIVASHLAAAAPELVRRLILVDAGGLATPMNQMTFRRLSGLGPEERLEAQRRNLGQMMIHDPAAIDELALYLQMNKVSRGVLDAQGLVLPDKLMKVLPKVRCQVDVIWAEFDRPHPHPEVQAEVIRRTHPDAELRIVPGSGHWAMYENAPAFNAHLEELLDAPLRANC